MAEMLKTKENRRIAICPRLVELLTWN